MMMVDPSFNVIKRALILTIGVDICTYVIICLSKEGEIMTSAKSCAQVSLPIRSVRTWWCWEVVPTLYLQSEHPVHLWVWLPHFEFYISHTEGLVDAY